MARGSVGSLSVSLALDAAAFVAGISRSEAQAQKFARSLERDIGKAANFARTAIGGLGVGLGVGAFAGMIKSAIDAADSLNDMSKRTGIAVETLGGIGLAAKQAGSDLAGVGAAAGKLNLQIAAAAAGNKEASEAFDAMKISVRDAAGNIKTADVVIAEIASKFATYADGPNKSALANRSFGKSYQDILPLLDDGGEKLRQNIEYYKRYSGITTETARQADEFNDTLTKLGFLSGAFSRTLASELLPSLQAVGNEFLTAKEKGDGFKTSATDVADVLKAIAVATVYTATGFKELGVAIGARSAQLAALSRLDFAGSASIGREFAADIKAGQDRLDKFVAAIRNAKEITGAYDPRLDPRAPAVRGNAPGMRGTPTAGDGIDKAVAAADRYLKSLEKQLQKTRELSVEETVLADIRSGDLVLAGGVTEHRVRAIAHQIDALKLLKDADAEIKKINEDNVRALVASIDATKAETKSIVDGNIALQQEIEMIGKDAKGRLELEQARIRDTVAAKQSILAAGEAAGMIGAESERIREQIDALTIRADLLNQKSFAEQIAKDAAELKDFKVSMADNAIDPLTDFITGTKTAQDAFRSFISSLNRMITQLALNSLKDALLGTTTGPDFGKLVAGLVGSFTGGSSSGFGMNTRAAGGPVSAGVPYLVGEQGKEWFVPKVAGTIVPNSSKMNAERPIVVNVNVLPGASRASADQAAAAMMMRLRRAQRVT